MTYFLKLRSSMTAGSVSGPKLMEGRAGTKTLKEVPEANWTGIFSGKNVVFAAHGFNVNGWEGVNALGNLEAVIAPAGIDLFVGILWPGDWYIPFINYPFEAEDAVKAGRKLATFCRQYAPDALRLSFISHSLGGRLILEAVKLLDGRAEVVCLSAAAVDDDCFKQQYAGVPAKSDHMFNLSSRKDMVLKLAYPVGDLISDALGDTDSPFRGALGHNGPRKVLPVNLETRPIPPDQNYGHGDYLPPKVAPPPPAGKWVQASDFMERAFRRKPRSWPP